VILLVAEAIVSVLSGLRGMINGGAGDR